MVVDFQFITLVQCLKWRVPVRTMARPRRLAASMESSSRMEPPGWAMATTPPWAAISMLSGNGKNASEARTDPFALSSAMRRARWTLVTRLGCPAPMPTRCVVLGEDDGVGLDVLAGAPGEGEVAELVVGGRSLGYNLPVCGVFGYVVGGLDQRSSGDGPEVEAGHGAAFGRDFEDAGTGAPPECLERVFVVVGSDDDVEEDAAHGAGGVGGHGPVESNDAAISGYGVALEGESVGGGLIGVDGEAAGVGVLDDGDGGVWEV